MGTLSSSFQEQEDTQQEAILTSTDGENGNLEIIWPRSELIKFNDYLPHLQFFNVKWLFDIISFYPLQPDRVDQLLSPLHKLRN